jgi:methylated-DNA-protein-cysteine methyltransferase-like protein
LEGEAVTVTTGALGELMVDFGEFGWFPPVLPSQEGLELSDEGDSVSRESEEDDGDE